MSATKRWWQKYVAGALRSPQAIRREAVAELENNSHDVDITKPVPAWDDGAPWTGAKTMVNRQHIAGNSYIRQQERADWQHCDPRLMRWAAMMVDGARRRGVPLFVHGAFRTKDVQDDLFRQGRSRLRWPAGAHCIGEAVDIVHGTAFWELNRQQWQWLHVAGRLCLDRLNSTLPEARKLELVWGGDWKSFPDPAHWEIADFRTRRRELVAGPPVSATPWHILRTVQL